MTIPGAKSEGGGDYQNWPLKEIEEPGPNDVMCGRGGGTNNHVGNIRFRQLVNEHKLRYLAAPKVDKPKVARDVVQKWRSQKPPGRFLTKSSAQTASKSKESLWHDVGDQKAREKASQCLRERTPDVMPFVQHLQMQQGTPIAKTEKTPDKKIVADTVGSGDLPRHPYDDIDKSSPGVDKHLQHLQELHDMQQKQIQQLQMLQQQLAAGVPPGLIVPPQDVPSFDFSRDPAAAAQALLDPTIGDDVKEYLRRSSHGENDVDGISDDASAKAIAAALFGQSVEAEEGHGRRHSDTRPVYVQPSKASRRKSEISLEEYIKSHKDDHDMDERSGKMDAMSKCSWVQSFQSIDSASMMSANSLGKIGEDGEQQAPVVERESNGRKQKMNYAKSATSKMSMISELTDYDAGAGKEKSSRTLTSRAHQMEHAKGMVSNMSMFSELTDMTGDFSNLDIAE